MSDSTNENELIAITPQEAVAQHERGAVHCAAPERWKQIADLFDPERHPWLRGRLGRLRSPSVPDFHMYCVDTAGLTTEQENLLLSWFYGTRGENAPGVDMAQAGSPLTVALDNAIKTAKQRRR